MTSNLESTELRLEAFQLDADEAIAPEPGTWAATLLPDEQRYDDLLRDEVRPLVDACRRLRERGLLD